VTPLYSQKLALTSPTGGGRSVGIVRVRTKATEFYDRGGQRIDMTHGHFEINPFVPPSKNNESLFCLTNNVCHFSFAWHNTWQRSSLFQLALSRRARYAVQFIALEVLRKKC